MKVYYLPYQKFKTIYELSKVLPSWEISYLGFTDDEIKFVYEKTRRNK